MAEAVFADMVKKQGLESQFHIDSAGTAAYHAGEPPDSRSAKTCVSNGVPVNHRARQVRKDDFSTFDYILCMDESNLKDLIDAKPNGTRSHVALFGSYSAEKGDRIIEDPYYGGPSGFQINFAQVTRCSTGFLKELGFSSDAKAHINHTHN
ncbi:Low molecular weight phosphotyrosine protein phosphatase [Coemansia sp. RSA 1365]|nr:Low molecular weight phosphotyrosine protein phosphatase [Coemansia sp. RSA 1365]